MQVGREDMRILINGPVLDHRLGPRVDLQQLVQPAVQKEDLQVERPARHVLIKIVQVRIMIHILELRDPFVMLAQHLRQRRFACADIPRYGDMLRFLILTHMSVVGVKYSLILSHPWLIERSPSHWPSPSSPPAPSPAAGRLHRSVWPPPSPGSGR